jgi:hypothetical protein
MACDTGMVRMQWGEHYFYGEPDALPSEKPQPPQGEACAPVAVCTRAANSVRIASAVRSMTFGRLCV